MDTRILRERVRHFNRLCMLSNATNSQNIVTSTDLQTIEEVLVCCSQEGEIIPPPFLSRLHNNIENLQNTILVSTEVSPEEFAQNQSSVSMQNISVDLNNRNPIDSTDLLQKVKTLKILKQKIENKI